MISVITSRKLTKAQKHRIETLFNGKHSDDGVTPEYYYDIDEDIVGGILIIDGEKYYDATLRGQLSNLMKELDII